MKIIITSTGETLESEFDQRFGRCAYFCVLDTETSETNFVKNVYADAPSGAGPKASEAAIELGAKKVISGDFGPKAKDVLEKFNVQMVIFDGKGKSLKEITDTIKNSK